MHPQAKYPLNYETYKILLQEFCLTDNIMQRVFLQRSSKIPQHPHARASRPFRRLDCPSEKLGAVNYRREVFISKLRQISTTWVSTTISRILTTEESDCKNRRSIFLSLKKKIVFFILFGGFFFLELSISLSTIVNGCLPVVLLLKLNNELTLLYISH